MGRSRSRSGADLARSSGAAAALLLVLGGGCGEAPPRAVEKTGGFRGPIVLITLAALRADAVGGVDSVTPRLDQFVAEASWSGTGVAAASWKVGSLASVMTGLPPSVHGSSHPAQPWLRPDLSTLAQELAAAGFATGAFYDNPWSGPEFGLERGFEVSRPLLRRTAERWLAAPPPGASFTWVDLASPGSSAATAAAGEDDETGSEGTPAAMRQKNAASRQESAALRHGDLAAAYRLRVAEADRRLGRLLDSLRRSDRYQEAIVVVLADHGEAIEGGAAVPPGRDLARASIEVPLAIRVPESLRPRLAVPAGATIGLDRVRATIVELAGLRPAPALAPSLLRPDPWVALSELWMANGYHEVALYEDGHQLRWRCRFAPADPEFDSAWREALSDDGGLVYGDLMQRLDALQRARPGCTEGEEVVLEAWPPRAPAAPVEDQVRRDRMIERLRNLRRFPPAFLSGPAPAPPLLRRRQYFPLAGWGLPLPRQWWLAAARTGSPD